MSRPRRVRRRAFPTAPVKPPNSARNQSVKEKVPYFLISSPFILLCLSAFFFSYGNVNYYCGDLFFFIYIFIYIYFFHLTLWPAISGEQTNHIVGQENSF